MTLIDHFKEFHRNAIQQEFPASARVLYYTLLGEFNSARWPDSLVLSTRDLTALTGLPTTSVHRAKHFLTSKGIVKCTPFKNKTAFTLPSAEQSRNTNGTVAEQSRNSLQDSNIHAPVDMKILDFNSFVRSAGTRENFLDEERLTELWLANNGCAVSFELLSYFKTLSDKHGDKFVESMIRECAASYGGDYRISLKYFRACVERKLKGDDKHVRVGGTVGHGRRDTSTVTSAARRSRSSGGKGRFDDLDD